MITSVLLRKAAPLGPPDAEKLWDALMAQAAGLEPGLREAFLTALTLAKSSLDLDKIALQMQRGDPGAIADAVMADPHIQAILATAVQDAIVTAAIAAAGDLPAAYRVLFNAYNPEAVALIQSEGARMVVDVTEGMRALIRQVGADGLRAGDSPAVMARAIRANLGLTATQYQAVANFRRYLATQDPAALERQLRDRRFDPTVQRAIDSGEALSESAIDRMTERYEARYLAYRAQTIARTEAMRALNHGRIAAWIAAFEGKKADRATSRRTWHVARDERTCPICLSIPTLNPEGVGFDEPFESIAGEVEGPPIHPRCRCILFITPGRVLAFDQDFEAEETPEGDLTDVEE